MRISSIALVSFVVLVGFAVAGCKPLNKDTYQPCYAASDCDHIADSCIQVMSSSSDRMCTRPCTVGADCPRSRNGDPYGVCLPVSAGGDYCYSACTYESDCPVGWICNTGTLRGAACTPR